MRLVSGGATWGTCCFCLRRLSLRSSGIQTPAAAFSRRLPGTNGLDFVGFRGDASPADKFIPQHSIGCGMRRFYSYREYIGVVILLMLYR